MTTTNAAPGSRLLALAIVTALSSAIAAQEPAATTRLKDIASLQGQSMTPLVGYGLVVGLNKTGDKKQTLFSAQSLANMLERFGVAVSPADMKIENVASVLVTAEIGPYSRVGSRLDVLASSIGDARSLQGGTLLPTPLRGPDGTIVALAQGPLSIGGFGAAGGSGGGENSVAVNHLTVGRVPRGAMVQLARDTKLAPASTIMLALSEPDFISAERVAIAINKEMRDMNVAHVLDAGSIEVAVPDHYHASISDLMARLEPLAVSLDATARVVINERTGTVVLGGDVRIGPAAVAHGNLSVKISTQLDVSQPAPLSQGQTTVTPKTDVSVEEGNNQLVTLQAGTTLSAVVTALNTLGVSPRDIISIMQALKAAGALRAEIVIL